MRTCLQGYPQVIGQHLIEQAVLGLVTLVRVGELGDGGFRGMRRWPL